MFKMFKKIIFFISSIVFSATLLFSQNQESNEVPAQAETNQNQESLAQFESGETSEFEWGDPYIRNYFDIFEEVLKHTDEYTSKKIMMARRNYTIATDTEKKMRLKLKSQQEKFDKVNHINEKYLWQTLDRKDREKKFIRNIERKERLNAIYFLQKAIMALDAVQRRSVLNSDNFKILIGAIYKQVIVHKFNLREYFSTVGLLLKYIDIDERNKQDPNVHKYLTFAYTFQEKYARKSNSYTNENIIYYQNKKNEHFLRYIELTYGKDTEEYQVAVEEVFKNSIYTAENNDIFSTNTN